MSNEMRSVTFATGKITLWSGEPEVLKLTDDGYRIRFEWVSGGPIDAAECAGELWAEYKHCDLPGPAAAIADYLMQQRTDPAVLELVPGVKELREENERLRHELDDAQNRCIEGSAELSQAESRIASLEQQLAAQPSIGVAEGCVVVPSSLLHEVKQMCDVACNSGREISDWAKIEGWGFYLGHHPLVISATTAAQKEVGK